ncbi:MAG: type III pantothenate kinase [Steroidobacteraceae bacterium]
MVLLVDIGNTRVKWARLMDGRMGKQHAAPNADWDAGQYARRVIGRGWARDEGRIVVSSVAGNETNQLLVAAARKTRAPAPEFVASERSAAGITTEYLEPWRLGVDRFVGAIGAHHLASGQPVCVVNVGTAMTIDLVDGSGRHHGGAIVPGPALMVDSLLTQTNGIRRRATGGPSGIASLFARTTRTAIGQGALYSAAAIIDRAIEEARGKLGSTPLVLLTGGGSAAIKPLVRNTSVSLPDLVLHGLAVWARHNAPGPPRPAGGDANRRQGSRRRRQLD